MADIPIQHLEILCENIQCQTGPNLFCSSGGLQKYFLKVSENFMIPTGRYRKFWHEDWWFWFKILNFCQEFILSLSKIHEKIWYKRKFWHEDWQRVSEMLPRQLLTAKEFLISWQETKVLCTIIQHQWYSVWIVPAWQNVERLRQHSLRKKFVQRSRAFSIPHCGDHSKTYSLSPTSTI